MFLTQTDLINAKLMAEGACAREIVNEEIIFA